MKATQAESVLATAYAASTVFSITSSACLAITWQHWAITLDVCLYVNCGCILYGVNTFSTFMGGDVKLCHFGTYGLLPAIIIGLCLGAYHAYRCCIDRNLDEPSSAEQAAATYRLTSENGRSHRVVIVGPKKRSPCKQWMPAAFCAAIVSCLSLAHAVVITDGYYKTCEQYRKNLIQLLGSRGREAQVINGRLSCGAVLDFMDYLQPDVNNWRRADEINTGFALQLAIISTWLNFVAWLSACIVNFVMARKRLNNLGEKFCCYCC